MHGKDETDASKFNWLNTITYILSSLNKFDKFDCAWQLLESRNELVLTQIRTRFQ